MAPAQTAAVVLFLSQRVILFYSFSKHRSYYLKMMVEGSWGGFRCCFYVPQLASAGSQSSPLSQSAVPSSHCLDFFQMKTFFLSPLLSCPVPECPSAFLLGIIVRFRRRWLDLTPPPLHPIFLCLNLQDLADRGTLACPHLHRRCVFQRRANRLWERPKVSKTVQSNMTQQDFSTRR